MLELLILNVPTVKTMAPDRPLATTKVLEAIVEAQDAEHLTDKTISVRDIASTAKDKLIEEHSLCHML